MSELRSGDVKDYAPPLASIASATGGDPPVGGVVGGEPAPAESRKGISPSAVHTANPKVRPETPEQIKWWGLGFADGGDETREENRKLRTELRERMAEAKDGVDFRREAVIQLARALVRHHDTEDASRLVGELRIACSELDDARMPHPNVGK